MYNFLQFEFEPKGRGLFVKLRETGHLTPYTREALHIVGRGTPLHGGALGRGLLRGLNVARYWVIIWRIFWRTFSAQGYENVR